MGYFPLKKYFRLVNLVNTPKTLIKMASCEVSDGGDTSASTKFSLLYKKGDLFGCDKTESLAHCVSKDLRMGKGIAKLFKQNFQGLSELQSQAKGTGDVAVLQRDGRYIYYLITKSQYFNKPTYDTLESSLLAMKGHCIENNVTGVSMPKIGCGLDQLQWPKVEDILRKVFQDSDIAVTVYSF